jgi:hypothetical protein
MDDSLLPSVSLNFSGVSTTSPVVASPPPGEVTASKSSGVCCFDLLLLPPCCLNCVGFDGFSGRSSSFSSSEEEEGSVATRVTVTKREVASRNSVESDSEVRISTMGGGSIGRRSAVEERGEDERMREMTRRGGRGFQKRGRGEVRQRG